jgi:hypothetical protein
MYEVEGDVIKQIRAGKVYSYTVDVKYRADEDDSDFPEQVVITYGVYDDQGKVSLKMKPVPVPPPGAGIAVASLSYDGRKRLRDIGGLRPRFAVAIAETQKRRNYAPFKTHEDVVAAIIFSQTLAAPSEEITMNIEDGLRKGKLRL